MRNVAELIEAHNSGAGVRYLYFWGHRPSADGRIGKSCLSQWWPAEFTVDGDRYRSAEHYMMVGKARLFDDEQTAARILAADTPADAKALGRLVRGFASEVWDANRFDIVVRGSEAKFGQDPALAEYLLGTGDQVLVEASPPDRVWGIGLAADDKRAADPETWRGLNLLGFALMVARDRLDR